MELPAIHTTKFTCVKSDARRLGISKFELKLK